MSDTADLFKAVKEQRKMSGIDRRNLALQQFGAASRYASANGLELRARSATHYQLRCRKHNWLINIYPGNHRLFGDKKHSSVWLELPDDWSLLDVVMAMVVKANEV